MSQFTAVRKHIFSKIDKPVERERRDVCIPESIVANACYLQLAAFVLGLLRDDDVTLWHWLMVVLNSHLCRRFGQLPVPKPLIFKFLRPARHCKQHEQ